MYICLYIYIYMYICIYYYIGPEGHKCKEANMFFIQRTAPPPLTHSALLVLLGYQFSIQLSHGSTYIYFSQYSRGFSSLQDPYHLPKVHRYNSYTIMYILYISYSNFLSMGTYNTFLKLHFIFWYQKLKYILSGQIKIF